MLIRIFYLYSLATLLPWICFAAEPNSPTVEAEAIKAKETTADEPLVVYDGGTVTRGEYEEWLRFIRREEDPAKTQERLAMIAYHESQAAAAQALGLGSEVTTQIALLDYANNLLHKELRRHLAAHIEISPEELQRAVETQKDTFYRPQRVRLYNLLKRYPPDSTEEQIAAVRRELETIRERILAGADFKQLAREESESQTRFRDGLIGWVRPGDMKPEVENITQNLKPGELSPVLATADGFTVLWCEKVDEEQRPPLEEIRKKVATNLRQERMAELWKEFEQRAAAITLDLDAARAGNNDFVAEIPDVKKFTGADVRALLQIRSLANSAAEVREQRLESVLRQWIEQLLAAERARQLGLDKSPEVQALLHWSRVSTLSTEITKMQLQKRFVPLRLDEIKTYFENHRSRFRRPAQTSLEIIMMSAERSKLRKAFRQAESIERDVRQGTLDFEAAAQQYSKHPSAQNGGAAGWLSRTQIAAFGPNVLNTVEALEDGQMSGLVQQPEGMTGVSTLWIVRRLASRPAKLLNFEEAKIAAENGLGNERTQALQTEIRREILAQLHLRWAGVSKDLD